MKQVFFKGKSKGADFSFIPIIQLSEFVGIK